VAQKYRRRNNLISAMQHDGSDKSAVAIENWILLGGGKVEVFLAGSGHFEDRNNAYLRLQSERSANLIIPTSWVVKVREGMFYGVLDSDFHILYEEQPEGEEIVGTD
jgi:hypothetical protein